MQSPRVIVLPRMRGAEQGEPTGECKSADHCRSNPNPSAAPPISTSPLGFNFTGFVKYAQDHKIFWFLVGLLSGALITSFALPYLTAANEPYVNPIHDSRVKWNMVRWISGDKEPCHTVLVIFPAAYAEDYANDWKEIFTVIRWPSPDTVANATIDKGISFRPIQADAKAVACAKTLNMMFSYFSVSKKDGPLGGNYIYGYQTGEAVPTLSQRMHLTLRRNGPRQRKRGSVTVPNHPNTNLYTTMRRCLRWRAIATDPKKSAMLVSFNTI
jgi:hypothetical protein